jgi:Flp pilus assembly protein TadD
VARKTLAELVAEFPHVPAYHGGLGACLAEQGRLALARGDADAAKSCLQEALAHYARARTRSPDDAQLRREEAEVQTILARAGGPVSP